MAQQTREETLELQQYLNNRGYGPLVIDGYYGTKTAEAYKSYLDGHPGIAPPAPVYWWTSTRAIGYISTILAGVAGIAGYAIEAEDLSSLLIAIGTVASGVLSIYGTIKSKGPVDTQRISPNLAFVNGKLLKLSPDSD
jgi:hypothetical protein